jgi:hypothetical protein
MKLYERELNFFEIESLKEKLRNNNLADREALPYLIGWILFGPLTWSSKLNYSKEEDLVLAFLGILVSIVGPWFVYKENFGAAGSNFFQKFFVLGWVVYFRIATISLVILLAVSIPHFFGYKYLDGVSGWVKVLFFVFFQYFYYARLGFHVRDVAKIRIE